MKKKISGEREYEDLDDLPFFEHIEWKYLKESLVPPTSSPPIFPENSHCFTISGDEKNVAIRGEN